jgi:hypothetical protein
MAAPDEMLGRADDRVSDTVDVRQEGLRDQRDSHGHTMSAGPGPPGHGVVTGEGTVSDKNAVRPVFARPTSAVAVIPAE